MTPMYWWLVDVVSRMLGPGEREAVRGDIVESGETAAQALRDLLGLIVRRQAALWKDWRLWLALVGLVAPLGVLLSQVSRRTADGSAIPIWMYANNWTWAYLTNAGARHDLVHYLAGILLTYLTLIGASFAGGFALGLLSPRTIPINKAVFCFVLLVEELLGAPQYHHPWHAAVFSLTFYDVMFPLIVLTVLVLLPSFWGMHQGGRHATGHAAPGPTLKENNT